MSEEAMGHRSTLRDHVEEVIEKLCAMNCSPQQQRHAVDSILRGVAIIAERDAASKGAER